MSGGSSGADDSDGSSTRHHSSTSGVIARRRAKQSGTTHCWWYHLPDYDRSRSEKTCEQFGFTFSLSINSASARLQTDAVCRSHSPLLPLIVGSSVRLFGLRNFNEYALNTRRCGIKRPKKLYFVSFILIGLCWSNFSYHHTYPYHPWRPLRNRQRGGRGHQDHRASRKREAWRQNSSSLLSLSAAQ